MKRVPLNTNLHIHNEKTYQGFNIQTRHGPIILNYLNRAYGCILKALGEYSRVCMIRFDLHVPVGYPPEALMGNGLINRFFESLRAKVEHAQNQSKKNGHRVHSTNLRYMWCREISSSGRVHFHIALLLNHSAYACVGYYSTENNNMFSRIHQAWGSALKTHTQHTKGLIHFPDNNNYLISRNNSESIKDAFYRVSYFCKLNSKEFNNGAHSFGVSRI